MVKYDLTEYGFNPHGILIEPGTKCQYKEDDFIADVTIESVEIEDDEVNPYVSIQLHVDKVINKWRGMSMIPEGEVFKVGMTLAEEFKNFSQHWRLWPPGEYVRFGEK